MTPPRPDETSSDPVSLLEVPPRLDKTCSDPVSLPFGEAFSPSQTVTMFSLPFHAPEGTNVTVKVFAVLDDFSGNPDLSAVGVRVRQCCVVSDSDITDRDTVGKVGRGSSVETDLFVRLTNRCDLATKSGDDFVYYLRLFIDSGNQNVRLSYSVE